MSTKTTNFELVKPALTDSADITAMNSNWDTIDTELLKRGVPVVNVSSSDGAVYTGTVEKLTTLYSGLTLIIIPNKTSSSTTITLNLNGLGAKNVRLPLSFNTTAVTTPKSTSWLVVNKPLQITYDGGQWKTSIQKTDATDLYGTVPVVSGGTGATNSSDALTNLGAAPVNHTHTPSSIGAAPTSHEHNYAGSSRAGGSATSAEKLSTKRYIDGVSFDGSSNTTRYATCSTSSGTGTKTASVTSGTFSLITGARVTVKFTNGNASSSSPYLNINGTGAKPIYWHGSGLTSDKYWEAGAVLDFVYNGTQWEMVDAAKSTVDSELNSSSENPVQNKVITNALNNKAPNFFYNQVILDGAELNLTDYNNSGFYMFTSSSNITISSYALNSKKVVGYLRYWTEHETAGSVITKYHYRREFRDLATGIVYTASTDGNTTTYTKKTPSYTTE